MVLKNSQGKEWGAPAAEKTFGYHFKMGQGDMLPLTELRIVYKNSTIHP